MNATPKQPAVSELAQMVRSLLKDQLGTFADGGSAIWVEPPQAPQSGKGVHVYIQRHCSQLTNALYQWRVALVLRGGKGRTDAEHVAYEQNLQKYDLAIALMRQKFPSSREISTPYREDLPPQTTFLVAVVQLMNTQKIVVQAP